MKEYICIDIGGTSIKHGVIREDASFLETGEQPTQAWLGGPSIMEKAREIAGNYLQNYHPEGICISTAGMVDCQKGLITYAAPLIPDYTGTPIKQIMEEAFSLPCEVENDVNCAGLAEDAFGAARGTSLSVCLTIGTGIGGAIIMNHKVFHGFSGSGCEVGYMHLPGGSFQDQGASSILVKKVAQKKGCDSQSLDGRKIFQAAKEGDSICIQAIEEMTEILGMGIANICYVLNPEIVVLGGGIMAQKEYLEEKISKALDKYLLPSIRKNTRLAFAQNQNQAGMLGAFCHYRKLHS